MTAPTLRVALVQAASGTDPAANRRRVADLLARPDTADADLVVLPEAFARDFGPPGDDVSGAAEALDGPFATALEDAAGPRTVVAGMFEASADPARPFNTLAVRGGARAEYRKIHLYDSFGYRESDRLSPGPAGPVGPDGPTVVDVAGWRVGLMTCYDLRFPELARALVDAGADVLAVPAAWVAGPRKVHHWRTLLTARAIENTVYVLAAGQPAPRYCGHSLVVDPLGEVVAEAGPGAADEVDVVAARLERAVLDEARATNPSLANRRL